MQVRTIHATTIVAACPHGAVDVYEVEFHLDRGFLAVEEIQGAIRAVNAKPIYQEDLTRLLAEALQCRVATRGSHGSFRTECRADPAGEP